MNWHSRPTRSHAAISDGCREAICSNPKIEEAAFGLAVGGYSDVITTDVGFHIVRILAT